jgi:hypothetical protein
VAWVAATALRNSAIVQALTGQADPLEVAQRYNVSQGEFGAMAQHLESEARHDAQFGAVLGIASYFVPQLTPIITAGRIVQSGITTPQLAQLGGFLNGDYGWDETLPTTSGGNWGVSEVLGGLQRVTDIYRSLQGPQGASRLMTDSGDPVDDDGMMPVGIGGAVGTTVGGVGLWLGSFLARAFGGAAKAAVFTAANGLRVRFSQLWPLVRRYGPETVASALGITVGALGTMLMDPRATQGKRKRRRGISARDVRTTRRTIRQLKSLTRMAGIGGGGAYRRRARFIPPHRHRSY